METKRYRCRDDRHKALTKGKVYEGIVCPVEDPNSWIVIVVRNDAGDCVAYNYDRFSEPCSVGSATPKQRGCFGTYQPGMSCGGTYWECGDCPDREPCKVATPPETEAPTPLLELRLPNPTIKVLRDKLREWATREFSDPLSDFWYRHENGILDLLKEQKAQLTALGNRVTALEIRHECQPSSTREELKEALTKYKQILAKVTELVAQIDLEEGGEQG